MDIRESILTCLSKYIDFNGRARRSEYWWFALAAEAVSLVLTGLGRTLGIFNVLATIFSIAVFLPELAVTWRRLHDIGKKGSWFFIILVPIVGVILLIVWLAQDSQPGLNEYGPNPKEM